MANYLALIRKADFVDLYKYGSLHINRDMIRQFSCKVEELPNRDPIFTDLSNFANAFDSTFTYLFIHYEHLSGRENDVNIADVRGVYPLDYEAKTELSISLDPRIEIHNPLWPNAVYDLQKRQYIQECRNGVSNIWKLYNISDSIESVNAVLTDSTIKEVVDELYENRHPSGDLPVWVYIMRYERHAFYPNNTIGAFMDTVNAIFNYHQKREVDSAEIESTMIMQFLQFCNSNNPNMQFGEVLQRLNAEPKIANFIKLAKDIMPDFDLIKIATLFYIYRNRYKEEFKYEQTWEEYGKSNGVDFSIACYMLGCILGHEHTYDCLYEHLPLAIFKKLKVEVKTDIPNDDNNTTGEKVTEIPVKDDPVEEELPDGDPIISDESRTVTSPDEPATNETEPKMKAKPFPHFPCMMGKPKRGGGFAKSPKPKKVNKMDDYLKLESQGWKEIKEDIKLW